MNTPQPAAERSATIGSVAWAIFFIWVGIAMLENFPWGWFLWASASLSWRRSLPAG